MKKLFANWNLFKHGVFSFLSSIAITQISIFIIGKNSSSNYDIIDGNDGPTVISTYYRISYIESLIIIVSVTAFLFMLYKPVKKVLKKSFGAK